MRVWGMGESAIESVMSDCASDGDRPDLRPRHRLQPERRGAAQTWPETGGHFIPSKYN